jgi:hypothetical protein
MKRIIVMVALMLLSVGAWAQYAGTGAAKRAGTHIKVDGVKLSREEQAALLSDIGGTDYNPAWQKAKAGRNAGMGLTIGGGAVALGGGAVVLLGLTTSIIGGAAGAIVGSIGGEEGAQQGAQAGVAAGEPYINGGLIATGVGLAAMGAGIPLLAVNCKRLNNIVKDYNGERPEAQLSLGPTGNGLGLTLSF